MPTYRTEKNTNFTVVDNTFIRDKTLSHKGKGLLLMMLSLPDDWEYSVRGLAAISKEGVTATTNTLHELEELGYLTRRRVRLEEGFSYEYVYDISERSRLQGDAFDFRNTENRNTDNRDTENRDTDNHDIENRTQINKEEKNKEKINKEPTTTDLSYLSEEGGLPEAALCPDTETAEPLMDPIDPPRKFPPFYTPSSSGAPRKRSESALERCRRELRCNTEIDILTQDPHCNAQLMEELLELAAQASASTRPTQNIGGETVPTDQVKERMYQLRGSHLEYVVECLGNTYSHIRNPRSYLTAALYNAPVTIDAYYEALVRRDLGLGQYLGDCEDIASGE